MENIASGLTMASVGENATDILATIAPFLTAILGILLAFFIIKVLVETIQQAREKKNDNTTI